ncbi:MAG: tRNA (N6-isopentenyl adenosine(37)-C2)-methylthiotransferase MiaB [Bacteroidales bacterium]
MNKKLYIETYGCQMNFSDSEIVASVMSGQAFEFTPEARDADVIFLNTCSIRDHAEKRVINRLRELQHLRKKKPGLLIGVLGCMAERLKTALLEEETYGMRVDLVAGPDAYRDLPKLLSGAGSGQKAINVLLSTEETYADISPVRYADNGVSAFISIMRGCQNYCAYCVVPYTRGKERSRSPESILSEMKHLSEAGYREVTLLGQNVNSYLWTDPHTNETIDFSILLGRVAAVDADMRIRFATSHPKDISTMLLCRIAATPNICNALHLPVQSGSSAVLKRMNRKYTREAYLEKVKEAKQLIPGLAITTDIIAGFCGETEDEHQETLSLMEEVGFDFAFMFKYSERPDTPAANSLEDDVPDEVKTRRLNEIIEKQQALSYKSNQKEIGSTQKVLVEGTSKRSREQLMGRTTKNKVAVFPGMSYRPGDYVWVEITGCSSATLKGEPRP